MEHERTYGRFYGLLKKMPYADKEELVYQFTGGRTKHLRQTSAEEYRRMCDMMDRVVTSDEDRAKWFAERKKQRSICLHLMQLMGVDTADWAAVNNFCMNPRICGKEFRRISLDELYDLERKLRAIKRKEWYQKPHPVPPLGEGDKRVNNGQQVVLVNLNPKNQA